MKEENSMCQSVLLTGGAGYIGSHTAVELLQQGYRVIIADDLSNSSIQILQSIEKITGKKVDFFQVDVANRDLIEPIFDKYDFDYVIHFAGLKSVGESVLHPVRYYNINLNTMLSILEMMEKYQVTNLVFSSSATVYGVAEKMPVDENVSTGGQNPYGWTKWMIEQILRDFAKAHPEMSIALLRYFNPIGAHSSGLIGELPQGIPNNLMPYISMVADGRLEKLHIFGDDYPTPDGTGVRDYIHVVDLAKGHIAALRFLKTHTGVESFNLGTGQGYSVLDVVRAFEKVNGIKIPFTIDSRRAGDIAECYANAEKAAKMLQWKAEYNLEQMCKDTWHWQQTGYRLYSGCQDNINSN